MDEEPGRDSPTGSPTSSPTGSPTRVRPKKIRTGWGKIHEETSVRFHDINYAWPLGVVGLPTKEPESAWTVGSRPTREEKNWISSIGTAWPQGAPEALWLHAVPKATRPASGDEAVRAESAAMLRLRVLLPDSHAAPSAARREELWQRLSGGRDAVDVADIFNAFASFARGAGLIEIVPEDEPSPKRLIFLRAAVYAAADECGLEEEGPPSPGGTLFKTFHRSRFRVLVQRMHQYLESYAVLADEIYEPGGRVNLHNFERLLTSVRHELALRHRGPTLTALQLFDSLSNAGEAFILFDKLARWSMRQQMVRPGSGALVRARRWAAHDLDPSSAGCGGMYSSVQRLIATDDLPCTLSRAGSDGSSVDGLLC